MAATDKNSPWPGERNPSHLDVASASERPDPALISDFKRVLLASEDAVGVQPLVTLDLQDRVSAPAVSRASWECQVLTMISA
jgi:hypothetical protein